jgi:hypothetical protein
MCQETGGGDETRCSSARLNDFGDLFGARLAEEEVAKSVIPAALAGLARNG